MPTNEYLATIKILREENERLKLEKQYHWEGVELHFKQELTQLREAVRAAKVTIEIFSEPHTSLNKREEARHWLSRYGKLGEG